MAIDFPSSPSNGDTYTYNGVTYVYNSTTKQWVVQGTGSSELYVLKTGDSMSGKLTGTTAEFSGNVKTKDLTSADATVDTLTSNGLVEAPTMQVDGDIIREWRPFKGRTSYNDYQGAIFVNRDSSNWSFEDGKVRHLTAGTGYLTLGSGYVIPTGYTETITYTTAVSSGAFKFSLQTSTDRFSWTTVKEVGGGDNSNSYTFSGVTEPLALRFVLANSNGTTTTMRLENLVIPNLTQKRLTDEVAGGGGIVESSDWVNTMGSNKHRYIKYADGTLICTLKNIGQQDGPDAMTWTFPHGFINEPCVTYSNARGISPGTGEGNCAIVPGGNNNVSSTSIIYRRYILDGYANNFRYYGMTAIGRWK